MQQYQIRLLSSLLRIAEGLDLQHNQGISNVELAVKNGFVFSISRLSPISAWVQLDGAENRSV